MSDWPNVSPETPPWVSADWRILDILIRQPVIDAERIAGGRHRVPYAPNIPDQRQTTGRMTKGLERHRKYTEVHQVH